MYSGGLADNFASPSGVYITDKICHDDRSSARTPLSVNNLTTSSRPTQSVVHTESYTRSGRISTSGLDRLKVKSHSNISATAPDYASTVMTTLHAQPRRPRTWPAPRCHIIIVMIVCHPFGYDLKHSRQNLSCVITDQGPVVARYLCKTVADLHIGFPVQCSR